VTSKVLISNFGPDPIRLRVVDYSSADVVQSKSAQILEDSVLQVGESRQMWLDFNHQIMIGEHAERSTEAQQIIDGIAKATGLPVEVIEKHIRKPTSPELRSRAANAMKDG
jgi:hypothetical protein